MLKKMYKCVNKNYYLLEINFALHCLMIIISFFAYNSIQ